MAGTFWNEFCSMPSRQCGWAVCGRFTENAEKSTRTTDFNTVRNVYWKHSNTHHWHTVVLVEWLVRYCLWVNRWHTCGTHKDIDYVLLDMPATTHRTNCGISSRYATMNTIGILQINTYLADRRWRIDRAEYCLSDWPA